MKKKNFLHFWKIEVFVAECRGGWGGGEEGTKFFTTRAPDHPRSSKLDGESRTSVEILTNNLLRLEITKK